MLNVCCGLKDVRNVSTNSNARGSALSPFPCPSRPAGQPWAARWRCLVPLCSGRLCASAAWWWWCGVLRNVVCRSCVAPVEVVALVLGDLERADDGTSDVLPMCFSIPTPRPSILSWARRVGPRRRARPRARRPPCTCRGVFI